VLSLFARRAAGRIASESARHKTSKLISLFGEARDRDAQHVTLSLNLPTRRLRSGRSIGFSYLRDHAAEVLANARLSYGAASTGAAAAWAAAGGTAATLSAFRFA
jgi:hypothetical protein